MLSEKKLNIYILLHSSGQRPQSLYLKVIFHMAHTSLPVIAVNACQNSLLWFIERVELLTPDPIQTQCFVMHLELALNMPAQGLKFHLDHKYLTPIWKGKEKENYICSERAAVHLLMIRSGNNYGETVPFHFGAKTERSATHCPRRDEDMKRQRKTWLVWFVPHPPTTLWSYWIRFCFVEWGVFRFTVLLALHSVCTSRIAGFWDATEHQFEFLYSNYYYYFFYLYTSKL